MCCVSPGVPQHLLLHIHVLAAEAYSTNMEGCLTTNKADCVRVCARQYNSAAAVSPRLEQAGNCARQKQEQMLSAVHSGVVWAALSEDRVGSE